MRWRARLGLACALASLLPLALAPAVSAECQQPFDPNEPWTVGDAFLATVTERSDDVDLNTDGAPYEWHVGLSIDETYVGNAPKELEFNGWDACGEFYGGGVQAGDKIIIAVADLRPRYLPGAPFEGRMVVWRKVAGGWSFYEDALYFGTDPESYPPAARAATTKADILRLIAASAMPSTSTTSTVAGPSQGNPVLPIGLGFALGLALALGRFRERKPSGHVTLRDAD
jgi:hypothetical protein